ncbi:hypothetical protein KIN20_023635 [Parelaphostrongylus tenuis]|uniref:G-protein coupled receptors family 1 profile domain-containing protein n=1 Tax=Parelaphostrongylus tenuis TaxID=148309 RepID=A0AAD5QVY2_PARTN|nr:hypothetical protein KIN20_023635 [Parelaphostrongylus tenuis]
MNLLGHLDDPSISVVWTPAHISTRPLCLAIVIHGSDLNQAWCLVMIMDVEELDRYCNRSLNRDLVSEDTYKDAPFDGQCLQMFFDQLQTFLRRFNEWEQIVYTSVYVIISILALIGNGLVILVVLWKREMRTNRNVLIANLALSNLITELRRQLSKRRVLGQTDAELLF